jgi:hypothetical protein
VNKARSRGDDPRDPMVTSKEVEMQEEQTCPNCGMPRQDWRGNNGEGYQSDDGVYCCEGCADGSGCTCS